MKIIYIIPRFPVLSQTFVFHEIFAMETMGHEIVVASFGKPSKGDKQMLSEKVKSLMSRVHYFENWKVTLNALFSVRLLSKSIINANRKIGRESSHASNDLMRLLRSLSIAALVKEKKCDFIFAHWPAATLVADMVHKITNVPFGVSIHAHEVAHDNGHFPQIFKSISFATFCNKAAMNYLLSSLPETAASKSYLVYHGVNLKDFSYKKLPEFNNTLQIVSAGRLTKTKGFKKLLAGLKLALERGFDLFLTIVGDGDQRKCLEDIATELGIMNRLHITGWVTHSDMHKYLDRSHVFALLADTNYHDGLPNVVIEAMATGRPVILSPLPSGSEIVRNGQNGYVISDADNVAEYVNCLERFFRNPALIDKMGKSARETVEYLYDRQIQIKILSNLFIKSVNGQKVEEAASTI